MSEPIWEKWRKERAHIYASENADLYEQVAELEQERDTARARESQMAEDYDKLSVWMETVESQLRTAREALERIKNEYGPSTVAHFVSEQALRLARGQREGREK
jgi:septation ring formation regulator EzrA